MAASVASVRASDIDALVGAVPSVPWSGWLLAARAAITRRGCASSAATLALRADRKDTVSAELAILETAIAEQARLLLELERRQRARDSLVEYARFVEIPGAPIVDIDSWSDEELTDLGKPLHFTPVESAIVTHHRVILEELQRCMTTPGGRLMIIAPPGSAKSTMAAVIAPTTTTADTALMTVSRFQRYSGSVAPSRPARSSRTASANGTAAPGTTRAD